MPLAMLRVEVRVLSQLALIEAKRYSSSSLEGLFSTDGSCSAVVPRCTSSVASPPSSRIMLGPCPLNSRMRWVYSQYSSIDLALVGEDGRAAGGDRRGSVVLGREDVAGGPAHLGAEGDQRLDQDGGLDRHVQRTGDAGAPQRLGCRVLVADRPSAPASPTRRCSSPCGRSPPGRCRRPCTQSRVAWSRRSLPFL